MMSETQRVRTSLLYQIWSHPIDSYVGLNDHPGVGQTHVSLRTEELQPIFQIPLSVVINLERQKRKIENH